MLEVSAGVVTMIGHTSLYISHPSPVVIRHVLGLGMVSVGVAARSSHVVVARHIAAQRVSATGEANIEVQAHACQVKMWQCVTFVVINYLSL